MPAAPRHLQVALLAASLTVTPLACAAQQRAPVVKSGCVVRTVADGDSFRCTDGRRVRLIGIDSPESQQHPYGDQARQAMLTFLNAGAAVRLETDVAPVDQYGRTLAYVWIGPVLVNEAMIRDGWAVLYTVPPNVKYADRLTRAQNEARARGAGLWSQRGFECLPSDYRRRRCLSRLPQDS